MDTKLRIMMLTSQWPTPEHPQLAPFIVQRVKFLRRAGVNVDVFHFRGAGKPGNYWRAWLEAQAKLKHSSYDLVHAQYGHSGLLAILPKRLPLVVTFQGSDVLGIVGRNERYTILGKISQFVSRVVASRADQAIVVSSPMTRFLPKRTYHVIPGGLDLSLFHPMPKAEARGALGLDAIQPLVLFGGLPGQIRKRFALAQEVIDRIRSSFSNVRLVVAEGVPHTQMPLYMNACDVLLLTSIHEGSPNVVKEALACNLAVVSTDVGDVRERIGPVAGCVVCADDRPETIADSLGKVLARSQRINGREAVLDLDEALLTSKVIAVYHQALDDKSDPKPWVTTLL